MSEIKTCEEYVVARVQEQENELITAVRRMAEMDARIKVLEEDIKKALGMWEFEIDENKEGQFTTNNLYQSFSKGYEGFYELYVKYMGVE